MPTSQAAYRIGSRLSPQLSCRYRCLHRLSYRILSFPVLSTCNTLAFDSVYDFQLFMQRGQLTPTSGGMMRRARPDEPFPTVHKLGYTLAIAVYHNCVEDMATSSRRGREYATWPMSSHIRNGSNCLRQLSYFSSLRAHHYSERSRMQYRFQAYSKMDA